LADFGISKQLEDTFGLAKSFVGTAAYMAPERLHGQNYSTASDVWSLGMIIFECATGDHPYRHARSYYDLAMALSPGCHAPRLDGVLFAPRLCQWVAACLTLEPAARPSSDSLLRTPFIISQYASFGGVAGASSEQLSSLAAAQLREWVRETFVQAAAAGGGVLPASATAWANVPREASARNLCGSSHQSQPQGFDAGSMEVEEPQQRM